MKNLIVVTNWTDAELAEIQALLNRLDELTKFKISLDENDKLLNPTIADGRLPYAKDCVAYGKDLYKVLNLSEEEVAELSATWDDFNNVGHFLQETDTFRSGMRDAQYMLGANLLRLCKIVHGAVELAFLKGKPGMAKVKSVLDARFAQQGRPKNPPKDGNQPGTDGNTGDPNGGNPTDGGPNPPIPGSGPDGGPTA